MSDCGSCGRRSYENEWDGPPRCDGCDLATGECRCSPLKGYPISEVAGLEPGGLGGMPPTLLERLLPGGCILDVPSVPDAVWGAGDDLLWAVGQSLIVAGPDGVGKTTLAGNLIQARLGLGTGEVLGLPVKPGERNVLVLLMDRPQQAMAALARLFRTEDRDLLDTRLRVWRGPPPQDLARNTAMLTQLCALADADTCVIDSLKDAAMELSKDETGAGWNQARQFAIEAGTQLLELHHPRKAQVGNKKPSALEDLYGSVWIPRGSGSVVMLWGQAGDPVVELTHIKPIVTPAGPWQMTVHGDTGLVSRSGGVDLLEQIGARGPHGITARIAAQLLGGPDHEPTPADVEKARRKLDSHVRASPPRLYRRDGHRGGATRSETTWFLAARGNHETKHAPDEAEAVTGQTRQSRQPQNGRSEQSRQQTRRSRPGQSHGRGGT